MRILVVKTSSLGDVIHTLPALTDAARAFPDIEFDWVVEEPFQVIPTWHKNVKRIIPLAFRRWRKNWVQAFLKGEVGSLLKDIRTTHYDGVIDAQGLLKSAVLSCAARGRRLGYSWTSARESLASLFYHQHAKANWSQHAVLRTRLLFAQSLGYTLPEDPPDYGIDKDRLKTGQVSDPYCVFLHGTTWVTKHWPEAFWIQLGQRVAEAGYKIQLLWGNTEEHERANRIAEAVPGTIVLPRLGLNEVAAVLANAKGIVSVDTGLGHLAAAFGVPTVSLYGPTDPVLTGLVGPNQLHLKAEFPCAPCFARTCTYKGQGDTVPREVNDTNNTAAFPPCFSNLSPEYVWQRFHTHINAT